MSCKSTTPDYDGAAMPKPSWKSLFGFTTRKHLPTLAVGATFALLAGCVTPALAIFLGNVFDLFTSFGAGQMLDDELRSHIVMNCLGMIGLGAVGWFLNGSYFAVFIAFGEMQASSIRREAFVELLKRDIEWFEAQREGSGAFLSGIQAHIHDLQVATSQPLGLLLQYSCRSVASLVLGFYTSWKLSLVTLAGIPIFSSIIAFLSTRMKLSITSQHAELTHASKVANNAISSIDTVKCLNGQALEVHSFSSRIEKSAVHYLKQARLNSLQIAFIRWMMFGMFVQGFWYGSSLARNGTLTSGEVLRTFWACLTAAQSIEQVLPQMIVMEKGKVASVALRTLMRNRVEHRAASEMMGTQYPERCVGDIQVNNVRPSERPNVITANADLRKVSFAYPAQPHLLVLKPSTFFFPAGETTFVIGKSGSGKSTLSQLLMRFYRPTSGEILIDQNPMPSLNITWIRNNITLVEQRSVLFNDSVLKNITFGSQNHGSLTGEDVEKAIALAMLHSTIQGLPKGIDTCVGPGGSFLSGGQRQRVAIARAKLRDTPILILDEPTSALDHTNRVAVMKAIREWRKGKTTIIITHDMSQILDQDFLYILEQGSIVRSGYRHEVEKLPGSEKYFQPTAKDQAKQEMLNPYPQDYQDDSSCEISPINTLEELKPAVPERLRQNRPLSWAQHHIPPSLRSSTWDMAAKRHVVCSTNPDENFWESSFSESGQMSPPGITELKGSQANSSDSTQELADEIEMIKIGDDSRTPRVLRYSKRPKRRTSQSLQQVHSASLKKQQRTKTKGISSLSSIMGTIVPTLTPRERCILFLGIASALAHASATPVFSYCLSQLFSTFYARKDSAKHAMTWSLAVLGVSFGDGLASFFMHYFLEYCGEAWMDTLRKQAFKRVLDQPRAWFEREGNGAHRLTSYLDQNGEDMRNLLGRFAGFVIVAAAIMVMAIIWSLIVCWKLTLVALACGPVIYAITRGFEGTNGLWERRSNEAIGVSTDIFTETFSEIRTVRTLTLEGYFHRKQIKAISRCLNIGLKRAIYSGLLVGMVESTVMFASAVIFYYGAVLAASEFTVNDVMVVFSLLLFSIGYAAQILSWIPQINSSREIATHILRLARLPEGSHEHRGRLRVSPLTPILLTNLTFRYPSRPKTPVLKDVSIKISQNTCTAIVGRSGSGKSTIASLLLSLYEAPVSRDGRPTVTLGGHDISRLHVPTLRSQIAIVSQQPTIFPKTIYENISYGINTHSPMSSMHAVRTAAQAAGIDDFISSLPQGYFTVIGDGGIGLSGGQKQRVVIARALVRQPQILILDEATSSLDPAGAEIVRQTVQRLVSESRGLTVIIITHAREMIEIANHVVVLDQGAAVEDGSYDFLARRVGGKLHELINDPEDGVEG